MRAALLATLIAAANAALAPSDIKDIVVFGDSISDTGNLYASYGVPLPPYKDGRFSNGPVWVEFLSKYLNGASLHDFAYGSSCADVADSQNMPLFQGSSVTTAQIPDLMGQLALFKKDSASKLSSKSTLVTVFAGGNDFNFSARAGKIPNPKSIADAVINMVQALLKEGVTKVLVGNMPPLDKTPSGYSNPTLQPILAYLSDSFNSALAEGIAKITAANPSADIVVNDINKLFTYATTPAGQKDFGIVDYSHTCFNQTAWAACAQPNIYLFWDGVQRF
ncbi:hypothetical protein BC830DRAFT_947614 [Chytriomyces sp. MP71]|nr:hypothetical protein BC830DRAFT_947614 [Chytriomyces sp. MP71]